jgi:beta-lactamase regulating signal transducer with metallopeptidase domain
VERYGDPLLAIWTLGAVLVAAGLWRAQVRFLAEVRAGRAGPSVVGVIAPRIFLPPDDGSLSAEERALIRAHEHEHIVRRDPRAGALAALFQCVCWFNPLVHLAGHLLRLDQELACDAAVLRRRPRDRALYARTLLKTQLAATPLPFGCYWPARGAHPLEVRIGLLKAVRRDESLAGPALVSLSVLTAVMLAWIAKPPVPPPPAIVEAWERWDRQQPTMSVMMISWPARAPAQP